MRTAIETILWARRHVTPSEVSVVTPSSMQVRETRCVVPAVAAAGRPAAKAIRSVAGIADARLIRIAPHSGPRLRPPPPSGLLGRWRGP